MVFNDSTTSQGIVQDTDFLCGTDRNTYPLAQIVRSSNRAMDKATAIIFKSNARFQWGDDNNTNLSVAQTDLMTGQNDYSLTVEQLVIEKIRIKDNGGGWITLKKLDITDPDMERLMLGTPANGTPVGYDLKDNSIIFYPTPNYTSALGVEIFTQRPSSYFTASDTTKAPGFASIFHRYVSLNNKFDYEFAKGKDTSKTKQEILEMEKNMETFYANRNVADKKSTLRPRRRNYD
jgi:hypothetical protein